MAKREMKKANDEVVDVEVQETTDTGVTEAVVELATGIVTGCTKLNLRSKPNIKAKPLMELPINTKVKVDPEESTDEWYKVITDGRVQGYCMKKYITLK